MKTSFKHEILTANIEYFLLYSEEACSYIDILHERISDNDDNDHDDLLWSSPAISSSALPCICFGVFFCYHLCKEAMSLWPLYDSECPFLFGMETKNIAFFFFCIRMSLLVLQVRMLGSLLAGRGRPSKR